MQTVLEIIDCALMSFLGVFLVGMAAWLLPPRSKAEPLKPKDYRPFPETETMRLRFGTKPTITKG